MYVLYMQWCLGASSVVSCRVCAVICGAATLLLLLCMCVLPQCCFAGYALYMLCAASLLLFLYVQWLIVRPLCCSCCVCVVYAVVYSTSTLFLAVYMFVLYVLWYAVLPYCCYRYVYCSASIVALAVLCCKCYGM